MAAILAQVPSEPEAAWPATGLAPSPRLFTPNRRILLDETGSRDLLVKPRALRGMDAPAVGFILIVTAPTGCPRLAVGRG